VSPQAAAQAAWKKIRLEVSPEEYARLRRVNRNSKLRTKRQQNKELFNLTARGTVSTPLAASQVAWKLIRQKVSPEECTRLKRINRNSKQRELRAKNKHKKHGSVTDDRPIFAFDRSLSTTSPAIDLAFIPVALVRYMSHDKLTALQDMERKLLQTLSMDGDSGHRSAGNQGKSLGHTTVSGGTHARNNYSGSIHINKNLIKHPILQQQVFKLVADIVLESYGQMSWFRETMLRLAAIPDSRLLPGRSVPSSHIWWTHTPKDGHMHVDKNSIGATFVFTAETVPGGELVVDQPMVGGYQQTTYHLTAGKIVGGSWSNFAHRNLRCDMQRRSWVVYLDYRVLSARYKQVGSKK
jgi:hypothetical protein